MGSLAEQQPSRQVHSVDKPDKDYQLLVLPLVDAAYTDGQKN